MSEEIDWRAVVERLRGQLSEKRISVKELAERSRLNRKTVDRLLSGERIAIENLRKIEEALGNRLDDAVRPSEEMRDVSMDSTDFGSEIPEEFIGNYFLFRRSFDYNDRIICSLLSLTKDPVTGKGIFSESQRNVAPTGMKHFIDFEGTVNHAISVGAIQLLAIDDGFLRVVTLGRPRTEILQGEERRMSMRGIIHTMNEIADFGCYPVVSPVHVWETPLTFEVAKNDGLVGSFTLETLWAREIVDELKITEGKFYPPATSD